MVVAILAALKAIPDVASAIRELGGIYKQVQEDIIDNKYQKLREETNGILKDIQEADTDNERRLLVSRLAILLNNN